MNKHRRFRYPHMLPRDQYIWDKFLEQHGDYFEYFKYDIHVGEGVGNITGYPPEIVKMAKVLTQKRIDAVGFRGSEIWVFEVKPYAGLSAIGQVVAYEALWNKDFPDRQVTYKSIVTDRTDNDIRYMCKELGIRLYEVG